MKKIIFTVLLLSGISVCSYGQTIVHDEQKEKQWRSMENGPWDFAPDWYYYLFHKDYSGASTYWAWRGFHSGLHVRFRESDSNVKRIMPTRVISEETQRQKMKEVETERANPSRMISTVCRKAYRKDCFTVWRRARARCNIR